MQMETTLIEEGGGVRVLEFPKFVSKSHKKPTLCRGNSLFESLSHRSRTFPSKSLPLGNHTNPVWTRWSYFHDIPIGTVAWCWLVDAGIASSFKNSHPLLPLVPFLTYLTFCPVEKGVTLHVQTIAAQNKLKLVFQCIFWPTLYFLVVLFPKIGILVS